MRLQRHPGARRRNYVFSALAGVIWYLQFFFYSMGAAQMGRYGFSSWTLHMASIIIFSTLWGIALREWRGTSRRTHTLVGAGSAILIGLDDHRRLRELHQGCRCRAVARVERASGLTSGSFGFRRTRWSNPAAESAAIRSAEAKVHVSVSY